MKIVIEDATASELKTWLSLFIRMKFAPDERHELLGQKQLHEFIEEVTREFVKKEGFQALEDWCFRADLDLDSKFGIAFVLAEMRVLNGSVNEDTVTELVKPVILHDQVKKSILRLSEQDRFWEDPRNMQD